VSFEERIQWVEDNAENIIRSAENPFDHQWWVDADSPFYFLAWTFEFSDWLDCLANGGRVFKTRIPVAMDGSCNGLQHYSAMLRDPRGGEATNLTPSAKPQDIYGEVAKVVTKSLEVYRFSGSRATADQEEYAKGQLAQKWLKFGIDRKIAKRPVMVLPYGGTQRSCLDYVYEAVRDRGDYPFTEEELHGACVFLGGVVWQSIGKVVVAARLAMGWIKATSGVVNKAGLPLEWVAPSGFPVVQAYQEMASTRIESFLFGARVNLSLDVPVPDKLDGRRQSNGVAPNFVHSMDASALIDTVNRAAGRGVTKFAMIHDSYGTTAAWAPTLSEALRDAFVEMYENNDVLEQFKATSVPARLHGGINSAPFVGGLDLNVVRQSPYFFA
jgi:DNA-directed RNA polymerase